MECKKDKELGFVSNEIAKLLGLYITEDQLNSHIKNTQNLTLLRTALQLKLSLIAENKHSHIYFPLDNILNEIGISDVNEICLVLQLALMVQCNESQYLALLTYVNNNLNDISDEQNLKNMLKVLQVTLSACDSEIRKKAFKGFIAANNFHDTICNLMFVESKIIMNFLNVYILPPYLKIDIHHSSYILQAIWKNALESKNLNMLCATPEFFLPVDASLFSYSLVKFDNFWFLLQECLNSNSSSIQKQALHLLKRAIHSLENEESITTETKVVFWNLKCKMEVKNAWQNLFMLFEIAREKQLHLIEPSYQLLPTIGVLHSSWLICLYKILLAHPHNAVAARAVLDVLKSNWYKNVSSFKVVVRCLLLAMNRTEFTDKQNIWNEVYQFTKRLDNEKFLILLQEGAAVLWIPPVGYQFYRNIFVQERQVFISSDLTEKIITNIERLPHKFLRSGCRDLAVNFIKMAFFSREKITFKDYIAVSWILYKNTVLLYDQLQEHRFKDFILHIEKIIVTWYSKNIDLKEAKVIFKMMELSLFENDWLNEHIFEPFVKKPFVSEISDRVCMYLCHKGIIDSSTLCSYIQERLVNSKPSDDTVLTSTISYLIVKDSEETELTNLVNKSIEILLNADSNIFQIKMAFEIIHLLHNKCNVSPNDIDNVLNLWKENLLKGNKKTMQCAFLFQRFYCRKELCTSPIGCKENSTCIKSEKLLEIISIFEKMLEAGDNNLVPIIFMQLKNLLTLCENLEIIFCFIDVCLKKIIELKRTAIFKNAVDTFTRGIFSNSKICSNDKDVVKTTLNIAWSLLDLARSSDDVADSLANYLCQLSTCNVNATAMFTPVIVELLLCGDILKKDQRAEYIACRQISIDKKQRDLDNPNLQRFMIRQQVINIIQNIVNGGPITLEDRTKRADEFTLLLMNKYNIHFDKRYFTHSHIHLQKLRILQGLLIVHDHIQTQKEPLIDLLMNSLCSESHQISVKFLIQWLLIRLLHNNDRCLSIITSKMESTSKVHSSTITAFVPILYHVALSRNDEMFWVKLFEVMLPWTMGAHFNLRLYAQEGIKKLYEVACNRGFLKVQEKFKCSADCIAEVLEKTERQIDPIDRFVFNIFNAKDHYNLQMIYFYIPKITNVTYDEYEYILDATEWNVGNNNEEIPNIENWLMPSKQKSLKFVEPQSCTNVIQKKISPRTKSFDGVERKLGELVVVASLIDKTPNLGGLSRTCEIFGVKQLILNTINIVKDHEFQSVSMSSENWVNILEAKVDRLRSFLLDMKEKGYSVVGAEQTSDSVQLNVFQFPKKCVLLLGNEKEGIPPNLLSLIDFCVEIPQFGVVRSLNVHVAAATFIWEYTKHHVV